MKLAQLVRKTGDQRWRAAIRKPGGIHLFVNVSECCRVIQHHHTCITCPLEKISRVNVVHIKRRIEAHKNAVELLQKEIFRRFSVVPVAAVVIHSDRLRTCSRFAVAHEKVLSTQVVQRPVALLCRQHHCQTGVLGHFDIFNRVHQDGDFHTHRILRHAGTAGVIKINIWRYCIGFTSSADHLFTDFIGLTVTI